LSANQLLRVTLKTLHSRHSVCFRGVDQEFHLSHGDWTRLLRRSGFEVEDLVEIRVYYPEVTQLVKDVTGAELFTTDDLPMIIAVSVLPLRVTARACDASWRKLSKNSQMVMSLPALSWG